MGEFVGTSLKTDDLVAATMRWSGAAWGWPI